MKKISNLKVLTLEGTPKSRGQVHGKLLKPMIDEVIKRWKNYINHRFNKNPNKIIEMFIEDSDFLTATKKWTPHLLDEVEGIAEGSGINFNTIFALQLMDEETWFIKSFDQGIINRCSSIGSFKENDRPTLLGQNLDWFNYLEGMDVLLHIKYKGSSLESFVPTVAGMIGTCGLNNQSIGICTNALWNILNSSKNGLPVTFIIRSILEQINLDSAIDFIHDIKHASGENYVIGNTKKVVNYECSANKICQYIPYEDARVVYHTNHPIINDDVIFNHKKSHSASNSHDRFNYIKSQLRDPSKRLTLDIFKNILRSHQTPICVHHNNKAGESYSFYSVIYSLSTSPKLYYATGPPCSNKYGIFKF